jgi:hypothetical protein
MEMLNGYHKRPPVQATLRQFQTSLHYAYYNIFLYRLICNIVTRMRLRVTKITGSSSDDCIY